MVKRSSWQVQKSVIYALFLREVNVRFSAGKLGYFWVIFEPLIQIFIFVTVKVMLFGGNSNIDYPVFITLGFVAFNLFRHIINRSMTTFKSNKGLYAYKQVKPIDGLIARVLVEILITTIIAIIFISVGLYLGFDMHVESLDMLIISFIWLIIFSFGFGLLVGVVGFFYDSIKKVVKLVLSPLMFVSAIFYSMQDMPQTLQDLLYYNPLVHFMELIHSSYFYVLDDGYVDYGYLILTTVAPLYMGLWLYQKFEKGIISL
ncbi:Capsular polysaccharide ABC transporter, permease protein KpsM [hydrothermal vent metagenome]|uniref:Capsular polysaccharide ABC transporter, permease protein KpsM n=1 Tax=hydrothermal vent metagenome TaxID=652676 RepID=A0A1W1BYH2_9ZZZZ